MASQAALPRFYFSRKLGNKKKTPTFETQEKKELEQALDLDKSQNLLNTMANDAVFEKISRVASPQT